MKALTEEAPANEVDIDTTKPGKLEFFSTVQAAETLAKDGKAAEE